MTCGLCTHHTFIINSIQTYLNLTVTFDFVIVCTFTSLKNRKTVAARRHVVRAPYGDPAMIVQSPHDFYDDQWGQKRKAIVERPQGINQKS